MFWLFAFCTHLDTCSFLYLGSEYNNTNLFASLQEKESWDLNTQEKVEAAGKKKEEGNVLFKAGKYARASKRYEKVIKVKLYTYSLVYMLMYLLRHFCY